MLNGAIAHCPNAMTQCDNEPMTQSYALEVDVWVRGTQNATTHRIASLPGDPQTWNDDDVRRLLSEMLLALQREKNPGGDPPPVTLRGFNWIVSPYEQSGVLLHLEMQLGTATAGPLAVDEPRLTEMIARVMAPPASSASIH